MAMALGIGPNASSKMTTNDQKTPSATDMTRRMICGGLAGMIAKVNTLCGNSLSFCFV
jgi:hypothetical protein